MRRLGDDPATRPALGNNDPARDATAILVGRGAAYPALSVAFGARMSVVGALYQLVGRPFRFRSHTPSCAAIWRTDYQPVDAPDGFRCGTRRRIGHCRVRRD